VEKLKIQTVKEDFCRKLLNQFASLTGCDKDPTTLWKQFRNSTEKVAAEIIGYTLAKLEKYYVSKKMPKLVGARRQEPQ